MFELNSDTVFAPSVCLRRLDPYFFFHLGERRKRHLQALEALLAPQTPHTENGVLLPNNQEEIDLHDRLLQRTPGYSTANLAMSPSSVLGPSLRPAEDHPMRTLAFIVNHLGGIDERTSVRIRSGEITIQDILQAGLDSLNLPSGDSSKEICANDNGPPCPALRTDKILILKSRRLLHPNLLPSVYTNNLRVKQFSTISALRANAERFGFTFEELTDPATGSPFYDQAIGRDGTKLISPKLLESMPHLKPIDLQFKHPHHAYIDLIPCSKFRQRFIQLTTMEPPMINKGEFCADLEKDGLICWASYTGCDNTRRSATKQKKEAERGFIAFRRTQMHHVGPPIVYPPPMIYASCISLTHHLPMLVS